VRALRLHAAADLRLHDEASPQPAADDVLVRPTAVGLCGSDRHWFVEGGIGDAVLDRPLVLGHEFVGAIASGPRAGERVAVDPAIPCGTCAPCLTGREHLCISVRFAGHGATDGALRSLLAWPARLVHPVPDSIPDPAGALLEPLGVALHALDLGNVRPGAAVGVFGCGPIGLLLVQLLAMVGARPILVSDPLPHRLAAAEALGGTAATGDVDVAFEASGSDEALGDALTAIAPGGRIVLVGIPDGDRTAFTASAARRKGVTFLLSRRMKATDLPRAIQLAESGRVALAELVTERHALGQWHEAFDALAERRGLKVVLEPQRDEPV
jgi:L-iditol 2-dehydrogenase